MLMATKKRSALKRIRQAPRRAAVKTLGRSAARTAVRTARTAISSGDADTKTQIALAASALDRAAKRGAIHPNNAARRKSRLAKAAAKQASAS
ncbi:MAG: hypothetical protein NVS1B1_03990 [Candidatus Limnocylindrales bacterium]